MCPLIVRRSFPTLDSSESSSITLIPTRMKQAKVLTTSLPTSYIFAHHNHAVSLSPATHYCWSEAGILYMPQTRVLCLSGVVRQNDTTISCVQRSNLVCKSIITTVHADISCTQSSGPQMNPEPGPICSPQPRPPQAVLITVLGNKYNPCPSHSATKGYGPHRTLRRHSAILSSYN